MSTRRNGLRYLLSFDSLYLKPEALLPASYQDKARSDTEVECSLANLDEVVDASSKPQQCQNSGF